MHGFVMFTAEPDEMRACGDDINRWMQSGQLRPQIGTTLPLSESASAHRLQDLEESVECDVVVSGAKGPRQQVMALCELVQGLRAIDGGPLANARIVEAITALLIGLNVRYKVPEGLRLRFTGLPGD